MNTHKLFEKFNSTIKLNDAKIDQLKTNRKGLRDKIKKYFKDSEWSPPQFYSQGSFPLHTNLNPIEGSEYDLDDGVYFICPESERKSVSTYHDRIQKAVYDHAKETKDKNTCVRVIYADGHHIDLPCYWFEKNGDTPKLAHKSEGFRDSDPKAFKDWVDQKISISNSNGQLRRVIRYLKAWKDFREDKNSSLKLLSGFILTVLACEHFVKDDCDDIALKKTIESIKRNLDTNFVCYRPTVPINENLLDSYSKDTVLKEFEDLINCAQNAIDKDCEKEASECWRDFFGNRFPLGKKSNRNQKVTGGIGIGVIPSVGATKPYLERKEVNDKISN